MLSGVQANQLQSSEYGHPYIYLWRMEIGPGVGKNGEVRGYCCEEMFKKFYQWMVDFYLGYYGEQDDEKVFLQYIVIYNLLQKMVVVDIGYYR